MYKTHRRPSSKLEAKTGVNITWKRFLLLCLKNKVILKLSFLQCLDTIEMKILSQDLNYRRQKPSRYTTVWKRRSLLCQHFILCFNNRDIRMVLVFLESFFDWDRNFRLVVNLLLINFNSEIWKTYSFPINWSFSLRVIWAFDLTLFERSDFYVATKFSFVFKVFDI